MNIFTKIKTDSRHTDLSTLQQGAIKNRNFDAWSMGFRSILLDEYRKTPGFFELDNTFSVTKPLKKFNSPLVLLKSFYDMHRMDEVNRH